MSSEQLSRDRGVVIRCDYGAYTDEPGSCDARHYTANIHIKTNRAAASKLGWSRGGDGRKRCDYCPLHAPIEKARVGKEKQEKADAKKALAAERAAKRAAKAEAKQQRADARAAKRAAKSVVTAGAA